MTCSGNDLGKGVFRFQLGGFLLLQKVWERIYPKCSMGAGDTNSISTSGTNSCHRRCLHICWAGLTAMGAHWRPQPSLQLLTQPLLLHVWNADSEFKQHVVRLILFKKHGPLRSQVKAMPPELFCYYNLNRNYFYFPRLRTDAHQTQLRMGSMSEMHLENECAEAQISLTP